MRKLIAVLLFALGLSAQTLTLTEATTVQATPIRPGLNFAQLGYYGPGQWCKNLFCSVNPGFEGRETHQLIRCDSTSSTTTCVGANVPNAFDEITSNFYASGGTFSFPVGGTNGTGAITGCSGTIASNTTSTGSLGATYTFSSPCSVAVQLDDYIALNKIITPETSLSGGGSAGNYNFINSGTVTASIQSTDNPPSSFGTHTLEVVESAGGSTTFQAYADATYVGVTGGLTPKPAVLVNGGVWTVSIKSKVKSCSSTCTWSGNISRSGSFSASSATITPTISATAGVGWVTTTWTVTPNETTAVAANNIVLAITTSGNGDFLFDDIDFEQTGGIDGTNYTIYRDAVVNELLTYKPGSMRLWDYTFGDSLDNSITPVFGKQRTAFLGNNGGGYAPGSTWTGIYDFLVLCQRVNTQPWILVPTWWSTTQVSNLIDFLAASSGTYSAKRNTLQAASGLTQQPFTSIFSKIHLELGNEVWNSQFNGESMPAQGATTYQRYGQLNKLLWTAARANTNYNSSVFDLILGCGQGQTSNCIDAHNQDTTGHDSITQSAYNPVSIGPLSDVSTAVNEYTPKYGEAWGYSNDATNGNGVLLTAAIAASGRVVPIEIYEYRENTFQASGVTAAQFVTDTSSQGSGLAEVVGTMERLRVYNKANNMWDLGQIAFSGSGVTAQIPLFGGLFDFAGGTGTRLRPNYIMQEESNQAIIGTMYGASWASRPVFTTTPALNGHVGFSNVPKLYAWPFKSGTSRAIVLANLDTASSQTITWAGDVPTGTITQVRINAAISATNENTVNVAKATNTVSAAATYVIPANTLDVLTFTSGAAPATTSIMFTGKPRLSGKPVIQ